MILCWCNRDILETLIFNCHLWIDWIFKHPSLFYVFILQIQFVRTVSLCMHVLRWTILNSTLQAVFVRLQCLHVNFICQVYGKVCHVFSYENLSVFVISLDLKSQLWDLHSSLILLYEMRIFQLVATYCGFGIIVTKEEG